MGITIIKDGSQKNIEEWEEKNHPRSTYLCERCGCMWKCLPNEVKWNQCDKAQCPQCEYFTASEYIAKSDPYDDDGSHNYCVYM